MKKSTSKKKKKKRAKGAVKIIAFKGVEDMPPCAISLASSRYNKTGKWRSIRPVIDKDKCTSCLLCWKFCPEACISVKNGIPVIDYDYCKGCSICEEVCVKNAISLEEEHK